MEMCTFKIQAEHNFSPFFKNNALTLHTISYDKERNPFRQADSPSKKLFKKLNILNPQINCPVNKNATAGTILC